MINLCECSLDELRAEICAAIEAVDAVLGRPPFPNPVSAEVVGAAHRAERALLELQARNRVGMVENCVEVHTTLPILCAALRTGSVNESPCLLMLRIMLSCLTVVMSLAKFPLSGLLKDAQELLPSDDVVLFKLLVASGTFTTDHMRVRLGLPPSTSATTTSRAAPRSKKPRTPKECPTRPPPALLKAMLEAPLHDECRTLLLSLCDTTSTFLDTVQGDGDVAALILSIHGEHLIPLLTPSSLLPCMRPGLADYFVDVMERQEGNVLLCSDANLLQVPPRSWSHSTLSDLCAYMDERPVHQQDAFGSLMVSAFLMQVLNRMAPQLLLDGAWAASDSDRCRLQLVEAGCHAAVLLGQRIHPDGHVFRPLQRQANLEVDPAEEQWLHLLSILLATGYDDVDRQLHGSSCPWLEEVLHTLVLPSLRMKALPPDVCPPQKMNASVTVKKKTKKRGGTDVSAEKESGKSCAQAYSAGTFLDHMSIVVEAATLLCPLHAGTVVEVIDAFVAVMQVALTNRLLPSTTACTALLRSISVRAWRKLRAHELHVDVPWTSTTEDVLRHATTVSCSCAWCVPFLVDDDGQAARVQLWGVQLTSSLIAVALVGRRRESERWLYPWSSEYVLGWLSDALTADQLDAVSTVIRASGAAPAAAAYVEKLLLEANKMVVPEGVPWLIGIEARNVSLESCQDGWQRVRDALLHASSREAAADEARSVAKRESEAAAMRARLAEDVRLANEQRLFNEEKDKKMQLIHQVQTSVRETCGERAREHADRQRAKQERQRQLQTEARARYLDEQKTLHAENAQRRRERFVAYQRRMSSAFRVQDFLEHLDLLPSRVMELMAAVQPYLDDISPDELLEFAVTGARRVPKDMQASLSTHPSIHDDGGEAASTQHHPHFWDEVVHGRETDMASQAAMRLTDSGHSYHYRLSPWLDLFSYDVQEDDEDGIVPAILPSVHVSAAVRVLPSGQVSSMGLASVMDGFLSLQRHRLVCLRSDVAQLTVLGFRYHYPFSEDWNCVEARLARMPATRLAQLPWEADAESEDDNTDTEEDADAVLPPVEFGI